MVEVSSNRATASCQCIRLVISLSGPRLLAALLAGTVAVTGTTALAETDQSFALDSNEVVSRIEDPWWPEPPHVAPSAVEAALRMTAEEPAVYDRTVTTAEYDRPTDSGQRAVANAYASENSASPATHEPASSPAVSSLAASSPAVAAEQASAASGDLQYQQPTYPEPLDMRGMVLRLFSGTAVVLGGCLGMMWLGKWWLQKGRAIGGSGSRLRLLETLALAPRSCVQLVQVDQQKLLVAVDAGGIKSVTLLTDPFAQSLGDVEESDAPATVEAAVETSRWPATDLEQPHAARNF